MIKELVMSTLLGLAALAIVFAMATVMILTYPYSSYVITAVLVLVGACVLGAMARGKLG